MQGLTPFGETAGYNLLLAQRLRNQDQANNGTIPGGLAHMLNQGVAAFVQARDAGQRQAADQTYMDALTKPQPAASGSDYQQPNAPKMQPGVDAAIARLSEMKGNPYAGRLTRMLAMQKAQQEQEAAALADQRAREDSLYERRRADALADRDDQRQWELSNRPPQQRRIVDVGGVPYYADTGEAVVPGVSLPTKAPPVRTIKQPDGSEVAVQWDGARNEWVPLNNPGGGLRPEDQRRKLTENQSKLTLFKSNMEEVAPALERLESFYDPTNFGDAAARSLAPGLLENFFKTKEGQAYQVLGSQWAEGALRIATGAAATQPEIDRITSTYFPQPGDSPDTVALKREMRKAYQRSIDASLGMPPGEQSLIMPDAFASRFIVDRMSAPNQGPRTPPGASAAPSAGPLGSQSQPWPVSGEDDPRLESYAIGDYVRLPDGRVMRIQE